MSNQVKYAFDLVPANADLINKINGLVFGAEYAATGTDKPKAEAPKADKPKTKPETTAPTAGEFKAAAKAVKEAHGEEFAMKMLTDAGVEVGASLAKSLKPVPEDQYAAVMAAWECGPADDDEGDDWGDDDAPEDDEPTVDADTVKAAIKAYAKDNTKEEAQAIMKAHKVKDLAGVDKAKPETLVKLLKALT